MNQDRKDNRDDLRRRLLVLRCQAGDEQAFSELFAQFRDRTRQYLLGLLGPDLAHDAQQEVWLAVYRRIGTLANPGAFRTWLFQITRHRAIDELRRRDRHEGLLEAVSAAPTDPVDADPLDLPDLEPVLGTLSPAHREVLILRFWQDLSYAEMATVIGCSIGTVRSRIHHAKTNVRALLVPDQEKHHDY